jgi:hypothetical protein
MKKFMFWTPNHLENAMLSYKFIEGIMRISKRGLEVAVEEAVEEGGEEGGEAWKEGDPWPPVQSDSEEEEEAEEEAKPSRHICKLTPKPSWKVLPKFNTMGPKTNHKKPNPPRRDSIP